MPRISRRNLIASGLALSTSSVIARSAWGRTTADITPTNMMATDPPAAFANSESAIAPREQLLFDFGWKFKFGHGTDPSKDLDFGYGLAEFAHQGIFRPAKAGFDDSSWRTLNLPHDWVIELPFLKDDSGTGDNPLRSHGYKPLGRRYPETSVGWYRREFEIPAIDQGRRIWIEFDGAFRDTLIWINGCFIGRSISGYVPFRFELTDFLYYGTKNYIALRVDASQGDGWWYEGAGVYRHVWLTKFDAVHLGRWETTVRATMRGSSAALELGTVVENETAQSVNASVSWRILDANEATVATAESSAQSISADGSANYTATARLANPILWSTEQPNLYTAQVSVRAGGSIRDAERVTFGVRTAVFDPDKGFSLNDKSLKIKGIANHQDHAGVGVAQPDRLHSFRLGILHEMGCNAVRTSHNMPTPELVEACDHMGMMMMCETRQMSSCPEGIAQLNTMIKRYRNSPSIIIWSIGNEEGQFQNQLAEQGARVAATMVRRCHQLDPTRVVSYADNGNNERGPSLALDIIGFNYGTTRFPAPYHQKYPKRPIFGSEVSSAIATRGEYANDRLRNLVSAYAGFSGYETPEQWWRFYGTQDWEAGAFAWSGFDYRGEPSPYSWPSISSQFGIVDTCGFPKDYYYYYRAWWRKEPLLHLFPHWNWEGREGDEIPVWVYSNLDEVELFVNGKSLGSQKVPYLGHVEWKARYELGIIEARGSKDGKVVLIEKRETTGTPASVRLTADRNEINADGEDVSVLKVEVLDAQGRLVPTANNRVSFTVSGAGMLIGVGNGDPNCQESDKGPTRSAFNGLAAVIIQSTKNPGEIQVEARGQGLGTPVRLTLTTRQRELRPSVPVPTAS